MKTLLLKKVFLFFLLIVISGFIFAQEQEAKTSVGIGAEAGGGVLLIIPHAGGLVQVPIDFANRYQIVPKIGYFYLFQVLNSEHSSNFLPLGIDFIFNEYHLGFSLMYYFSLKTLSEGIITAAIKGTVPLYSSGNINLELFFNFGPAFLFNSGQELKIYPLLQPGLMFRYFFT